MDEERIAGELVALAETYEAKARQLRQAADVVTGNSANPSSVATVDRPNPTREDYKRVVSSGPDTNWEAATLVAAMEVAGFQVNYEAARTQLYRMEKRGEVVKHGRGTWRSGMALGVVASDLRPSADTPFVQANDRAASG